MVVAAVTDLDRRRIPNLLTGLSAFLAVAMASAGLSIEVPEAVAAATAVGLPLGALATFRPDGFGMGDAKLIAVMALFLGWEVWLPLFAGLTLATCFGLVTRLSKPSRSGSVCLPLAPFLAAGTLPLAASALPLLH